MAETDPEHCTDALMKLRKYSEEAAGIPSRKRFDPIENLPVDRPLKYVLHSHLAEKAGPHHDLRIGDNSMYSWAIRKGLPAPGKKHYAARQPQHSVAYNTFRGILSSGYGKGKVDIADSGSVFVSHASPDKIKFTIAHKRYPETFALVRMTNARDWLLINTTPVNTEMPVKPKYTVIDEKDMDTVLKDFHTVSPKIDGARGIFKVMKNKIEALSHRISAEGRPIVHTQRIQGLENLDIPKDIQGKTYTGEIYGERKGKVISPQELSGLLNASVENSRRMQEEKKIRLKAMLFDMDTDKPYSEKIREIQNDIKHLPGNVFNAVPVETQPDRIRKLIEKIKQGRHPLTSEGIVAYPERGNPKKMKFRPEADVIIRDIFKADTKKGKRAGGFS
ncbi:MAG: hypothetical protein EOM18_17185, partial [Clostridia bacterium]|nr:hypothetical protein [Clostridia bacterium]